MKVKDFKITRSIGEYEKVEYTVEDIFTTEQAEEYIAQLKENPVKKPQRKIEGISDAQVKFLQKLIIQKKITEAEIEALLKQYNVHAFNQLSKMNASKVIDALVKIK